MMKRILLMLLVVIATGICAKAQQPMATLSHKGVLTQFTGPTCIGAAHNAAVDGDTIFLSAAKFVHTGLEENKVTKELIFIGCGRKSHIVGNLDVPHDQRNRGAIDFMNGISVDTLTFYGAHYNAGYKIVNSKVDCVRVETILYFDGTIPFLNFESCELGKVDLKGTRDGGNGGLFPFLYLNIKNSKIGHLKWATGTSTTEEYGMNIQNCNIDTISAGYSSNDDFRRIFSSCIINNHESGNKDIFQNCLISNNLKNSIEADGRVSLIDCYTHEGDPLDENLELVEGIDLEVSGFLDIYDTPIGIYGGLDGPYSELPSFPTVDLTKSEVEYDRDASRLKVNITVAE